MWLFLGWVFLASLGPTVEFDLWFRLRYGQDILEQHRFITEAHYLWPQPPLGPHFNPCFDWGFSVLCYLLYRCGGLAILPFAKSTLVLLIFLVQWKSLARIRLAPAARPILLFLVYKLLESRLMLRPQLVTDLGLAIVILLSLVPKQRLLYVKVGCLFFLWSNLHSGVMAGFPVLFFVFAGPDLAGRRLPWRAAKLVGAALMGALLRPYSPQMFYSILHHMGGSGWADFAYNVEWQPLVGADLRGWIGIYLALTLATAVWGLVRWRTEENPSYLSFLMTSGALWYLAAKQVRGLGEVAGATPALIVQAFGPRPLSRLFERRPAVILVGVLLCAAVAHEGLRSDLLNPMPNDLYPDRAVDIILRHNPTAGVFCSYHFGGYLAFRRVLPFIHGMTSFFPAQRFTDYLGLLREPEAPQKLSELGIGWVLLNHLPPDDVHSVLAAHLEAGEGGWGLVYFDDSCMLFAGPGTALPIFRALRPTRPDAIAGSLEVAAHEIDLLTQRLGSEAPLVLQLRAQLALHQQQPDQALELWNAVLRVAPHRAPALLARSSLLFGKGLVEASQADLEAYLKLNPESAIGHFNLALAYLRMAQRPGQSGQQNRARAELDAALRIDPHFQPALKLRDQLR